MAAWTSPLQQPTPPSSSHGEGGSWDFAVPVNVSSTSYEEEPYMSEYVTATRGGPRHPHTTQANGFAKPVRSPTWDSAEQHEYGQPRMAPDRQDRMNKLHKKASGDVRAIINEQEGAQDYFKSHAITKKGPSSVKSKPKKQPARSASADPSLSNLERDETNWIHRDKLKEIETRELEEAGFRVGRSSRSTSRSQSASRRARARTNSGSAELAQVEDQSKQKIISPVPAEDDEAFAEYNDWNTVDHDQTTQELQPPSPRTNHNVRPTTSRIPLPKTSGIPVPASLADRDAPLTKSRTGSMNWNGDATVTHGARMRSGSVGSQALLDDAEDRQQTTPPNAGHSRHFSTGSRSPQSPQKSPVKAKTPGKPNPVSGTRKTSAQKAQPKRLASGATPGKRPGTSSGAVSRPTTSHRPEGEAPWIATMYKPDPRLPPDQQIIPTHAKRMQQQQWESEGRAGSMYDKDFGLIDDSPPGNRLSQIDPIELEKARENGAWPLSDPEQQDQQGQPLEKIETDTAKSPTNEQGGYRLTPTIPQGVRSLSPRLAPPIEPPKRRSMSITRVPEPLHEEKEKKGCGCIIM